MARTKVVITGAGGMLATALEAGLGRGFPVTALTEQQLDITDREAVFKSMQELQPELIINTAAYTAVDQCESDEARAMLINGTAVGYLARAARKTGARLIHISTDYVFDGEKEGPYREEDKTNPLSVYGRSKLLGEQELINSCDTYVILRTQWLFGENGKNFVDTILQLAQENGTLKVVDDQYGSPTYTRDLVSVIRWFAEHPDVRGKVFHFSNEGVVSWFRFAREILMLAGMRTDVIPVDSSEFPRPARRPHNSALDKTAVKQMTKIDIRPWYDALYEYMETNGRLRQPGL